MGMSIHEWIQQGSVSEEIAEKRGLKELVRCRNCVECYFASNRIQSEQTFACGKHGIDVTPAFFCADGERKE